MTLVSIACVWPKQAVSRARLTQRLELVDVCNIPEAFPGALKMVENYNQILKLENEIQGILADESSLDCLNDQQAARARTLQVKREKLQKEKRKLQEGYDLWVGWLSKEQNEVFDLYRRAKELSSLGCIQKKNRKNKKKQADPKKTLAPKEFNELQKAVVAVLTYISDHPPPKDRSGH